MMFRLPRFCPVLGSTDSQVQCLVCCTCLAASLWQIRQAAVTSGPVLKFFCNSLNLLWSAVELVTGLGGVSVAGTARRADTASGCAVTANAFNAASMAESVNAGRGILCMANMMSSLDPG